MIDRLRRAFRRAPETRDAGAWWPLLGGLPTNSGQAVSPRNAENLAAVQACVSVIAGSIATLPGYIRRRDGPTLIESPEHPASALIDKPNPCQTWPEFVETLVASALLHGNGLARIDTDHTGQPVALVAYPWGNVAPLLLPSGKLAFDVTQVTAIAGGTGQTRRLLQDEVLLLKDRSDDGILGRSRISRSPDVIGNALGLQEWSGSVWRNSTSPSGVVKLPPNISAEGMKRLTAQFDALHTGSANARRTVFIDNTSEWTQFSPISPEDAQILESRRFSTEEIARLFGVPPPLIADYSRSTFTNAETAGRWLAIHTLRPWIEKLEAAFQAVFAPQDRGRYALEIDLAGLLRGDDAQRWQSYQIARANGILTVDEIREMEGFNPLPAGQVPAPAASAAASTATPAPVAARVIG
jgi:HK97 family phage portal protein